MLNSIVFDLIGCEDFIGIEEEEELLSNYQPKKDEMWNIKESGPTLPKSEEIK